MELNGDIVKRKINNTFYNNVYSSLLAEFHKRNSLPLLKFKLSGKSRWISPQRNHTQNRCQQLEQTTA